MGGNHSRAVKADGTPPCEGRNLDGQLASGSTTDSGAPVTVTGLTDIASLARHQSCAVTASGGAFCWGYNAFGQLGSGGTTTQSALVAVSA